MQLRLSKVAPNTCIISSCFCLAAQILRCVQFAAKPCHLTAWENIYEVLDTSGVEFVGSPLFKQNK